MLVMWGIQEKAFALLIEGKPEMQLICLIILIKDTRISNPNSVSLVMETQLSSSVTAEDSLSRLRDCIAADDLPGEGRLRRKSCCSRRCDCCP